MAAAESGPSSRIEGWLEQNLPALRAYVRIHLGAALRSRESASDVVQSVCREILADVGEFAVADERSFRHWLCETARRKLVDRSRYWARLRRRSPGAILDDVSVLQAYGTASCPSDAAAAREELSRVEAAIDRLSPEHRDVILLARVLGLPHADTAERLGRSEGAVRVLLYRAMAKLGEELGMRDSADST